MLKVTKLSLIDNTQTAVVPFRNTLLEALFPSVGFRLYTASLDPKHRAAMLDSMSRRIDGFGIDFASGSRKHGDVWFSNAATPVSANFWSTAEQVVAYGSCLTTECREIFRQELRVLVVKDGEHGTGDCHGKASDALFADWRLYSDNAIQFRLAVLNPLGDGRGHLAKGTLAVGDVPKGVDLVLPLSAFKSFVPTVGRHVWRATVGIVAVAEPRRTKLSYTALQWFDWATVERDVLPHVEAEIARLRAVSTDNRAAVEFFGLDDKDEAEDFVLHQILKADVHGRLNLHPYIVHRVAGHLRNRWLHCATGGGIRWTSLMALPCDHLPLGTISAPHWPEGEVLLTRYPIRSWADVRVVRNVHRPANADCPSVFGSVWMSHATAAVFGGDFDGDPFTGAPTTDFPTMAAEVKSWSSRSVPPVVKSKNRLATPVAPRAVAETMMKNAQNQVGLITYHIASAAAGGHLDAVAELVPLLQISVDSFKYDLELDVNRLTAIASQLFAPAWLRDAKHPDVFASRPLAADGQARDTISRLACFVAQRWLAPKLISRPLLDFKGIFEDCPRFAEEARLLVSRFAQQVGQLVRRGDNDGWRRIFGTLREWAETRTAKSEWASALWRAVHSRTASGTGSLVFQAFPTEIAGKIQEAPRFPASITVNQISQGEWAADHGTLDGVECQVEIIHEVLKGLLRCCVHVGGRRLGYVDRDTPCEAGSYRLCLSVHGKVVKARVRTDATVAA